MALFDEPSWWAKWREGNNPKNEPPGSFDPKIEANGEFFSTGKHRTDIPHEPGTLPGKCNTCKAQERHTLLDKRAKAREHGETANRQIHGRDTLPMPTPIKEPLPEKSRSRLTEDMSGHRHPLFIRTSGTMRGNFSLHPKEFGEVKPRTDQESKN